MERINTPSFKSHDVCFGLLAQTLQNIEMHWCPHGAAATQTQEMGLRNKKT
jgi:hypothetical protein